MGTQTVTIQKVAQLLERINPETCTNVIAIKDGNETVTVTEEDYGEAQEESKA